jgi:hypothetical protein
MLSFRFGKGGGVLTGPVPEVGGKGIADEVNALYRESPAFAQVLGKIEGSRASWARMWVQTLETLLPNHKEAHARIRRNFGVEEPRLTPGTRVMDFCGAKIP